jgi:hypothetical protein
MKNLIIILVVVVLIVLIYNFTKKKNDVVSYAATGNTPSSNITNYAGVNTNTTTTATPPIVPVVNKYIYIKSNYTTGVRVYKDGSYSTYVTLPAGSYVGELKETKIVGGYETYVTTSGRYVNKMFSELKAAQ